MEIYFFFLITYVRILALRRPKNRGPFTFMRKWPPSSSSPASRCRRYWATAVGEWPFTPTVKSRSSVMNASLKKRPVLSFNYALDSELLTWCAPLSSDPQAKPDANVRHMLRSAQSISFIVLSTQGRPSVVEQNKVRRTSARHKGNCGSKPEKPDWFSCSSVVPKR